MILNICHNDKPQFEHLISRQLINTKIEDCITINYSNSSLSLMDEKPSRSIVILPDRLQLTTEVAFERSTQKRLYFNIDNDFVYEPAHNDFGPLDIGTVWRYASLLNGLLERKDLQQHVIIHQTSKDPHKLANSALLISAFLIIARGMSAEEAYLPLQKMEFLPFIDAGRGKQTYGCTIKDCLRGLEKAIDLGWFNFQTFNLTKYRQLAQWSNGNISWIIPGKILAFKSPQSPHFDQNFNKFAVPLSKCIQHFKQAKVQGILQLNSEEYSLDSLEIGHYKYSFEDGSSPSEQILEKCLKVIEETDGAIAIHCQAGLGRTGCIIACYCINKFNFDAAAAIAWVRLVRPSSIVGVQNFFLIQYEKEKNYKLFELELQFDKGQNKQTVASSEDDEEQLQNIAIQKKFTSSY